MDSDASERGVSTGAFSRRKFLGTVGGSTAVMLLAACQPAAPAASPTTAAAKPGAPAATTAPAAPAAPVAAPTSAPAASKPAAPAAATGTLSIGINSEPLTLDPQFIVGTAEYMVAINVMDGLFTTGENLQVVPRLAESHKQIDDNTWEFKLRQGVKFHNGETLTANAVKVTYERSVNKDLKVRNAWAEDVNIDRVEVVDDNTVRFHTKSPTPHMLARLANDHYIYPPKWVTETDPKDSARKPVGTGAYIFKEWLPGERITLEANPNYWGSPKPSIQTVTFRVMPEHTSRLANLRTGAIQLMAPLDPVAIPQVQNEPTLQVISAIGGRRVYAGFNTKLQPVDDLKVRQALNYGTDVESITRSILGGATTRMKNYVNAPFEDPSVQGYSYDPAKAKQLLTEAGFPNGFEITWDVDNGNYLGIDEFPQAVASSLRGINVRVNINKLERNVMAQRQRDRQTNAMYLRSIAPFFDPGLEFQGMRTTHAGNGTQWDDPAFQDLLKKLYSGGTPEQRKQWSFEAQKIAMEQASLLFLWKQPDIFAASKKLQGFKPNGDERTRVWEMSLTA